MLAIESYVPAVSADASYVKVTLPPAVGGLVLTRHSVLSAGVVRFLPLEPVRFSAPELPPEPGSGVAVSAPPPPAGFMSFQSGATTLFGRAAFGNVCGANWTSAEVPPPITTYPFETT